MKRIRRTVGLILVIAGALQLLLAFGDWAKFTYASGVMPELSLSGTANILGGVDSAQFGQYQLGGELNSPIFGSISIAIAIGGIISGLTLAVLAGSSNRRFNLWAITTPLILALAGISASVFSLYSPEYFFGGSQGAVPESAEFNPGSASIYSTVLSIVLLVVTVAAGLWNIRQRGSVGRQQAHVE